MRVKIDPEFEALIPKLSPEEFALLEANIRRDGCRDKLRQWGNILLDGHNRYRICTKWELPFGATPIELRDREAARLWIEENQLGRRNLTDDQRAIVAGRVAERRAKIAKKVRASEGGKTGGRNHPKVSSVDGASTKLKGRHVPTVEAVAKESRLPERKVRAAMKINKDSPELAQKVLDGEMPLAKASREAKTTRKARSRIVSAGSITETQVALAQFAIMLPLGIAKIAYNAALECYDINPSAASKLRGAWQRVQPYYKEFEDMLDGKINAPTPGIEDEARHAVILAEEKRDKKWKREHKRIGRLRRLALETTGATYCINGEGITFTLDGKPATEDEIRAKHDLLFKRTRPLPGKPVQEILESEVREGEVIQ